MKSSHRGEEDIMKRASSINIITETRDNGEYVGIHAFIDDNGRGALDAVMDVMDFYHGCCPITAQLVAVVGQALSYYHAYILPFVEENRHDAITYPGAGVPDDGSTHVTLTIDATSKVIAIYDDMADNITEMDWDDISSAEETIDAICATSRHR